MRWPWTKQEAAPETRAATGFTSLVIASRASFISGTAGLGELTATVQACVSLWEGALQSADVTGTDFLDRQTLGLMARGLALRGESVFLIRDRLVPAQDWELSTRDGVPSAYRLTIPEAGGGRTETALAGEVFHLRLAPDAVSPWAGQSPLRRARLSADLLQQVEGALRDIYRDAPMGSQIVPLPENPDDMDELRDAFKGRRGGALVVAGIAQAVAAGMHPQVNKGREDLTPDLRQAQVAETLPKAQGAIANAYGVLPALLNPSTTGPLIREAQRHLATWTLQPVAMLIADEARAKLGGSVSIDVLRPLQAYDAGGRARAFSGLIQGLAQAKEAGIDPEAALQLIDWTDRPEAT